MVSIRYATVRKQKNKLRIVSQEDYSDLLKVNSDKKSVPFFNSDGCHGDDFHYTTESRMKKRFFRY